jgi:hypothetical protein
LPTDISNGAFDGVFDRVFEGAGLNVSAADGAACAADGKLNTAAAREAANAVGTADLLIANRQHRAAPKRPAQNPAAIPRIALKRSCTLVPNSCSILR